MANVIRYTIRKKGYSRTYPVEIIESEQKLSSKLMFVRANTSATICVDSVLDNGELLILSVTKLNSEDEPVDSFQVKMKSSDFRCIIDSDYHN